MGWKVKFFSVMALGQRFSVKTFFRCFGICASCVNSGIWDLIDLTQGERLDVANLIPLNANKPANFLYRDKLFRRKEWGWRAKERIFFDC